MRPRHLLLLNDITKTGTGEDFAKHLLAPGSSRDPNEMLTAFLGRPASTDAFAETYKE